MLRSNALPQWFLKHYVKMLTVLIGTLVVGTFISLWMDIACLLRIDDCAGQNVKSSSLVRRFYAVLLGSISMVSCGILLISFYWLTCPISTYLSACGMLCYFFSTALAVTLSNRHAIYLKLLPLTALLLWHMFI